MILYMIIYVLERVERVLSLTRALQITSRYCTKRSIEQPICIRSLLKVDMLLFYRCPYGLVSAEHINDAETAFI